jgi:ABC-2 type transport system permease protein
VSSVAAAPAAPAAVRRAHRPSTFTVYRWELRKLVSQKRTYLGLALGVSLPLIFVLVELIRNQPAHGDTIFAQEILQSGLATPVFMLGILAAVFLPVIASLVAGDIVANEDGNGTLKTILTRSVDRGQVFAAKTAAAITYGALAVYLAALVGTGAGVAAWGFHGLRTLSDTFVAAPKALLLVFASYTFFLIPLIAVIAIGVLLSTVTRNSAAAIVGTIGLTILIAILSSIPGLEGLHPYELTQQYFAWQGLLRTPTDWAPITHSLWVCALYAVPSLVAGYLVFLRRDVAGG